MNDIQNEQKIIIYSRSKVYYGKQLSLCSLNIVLHSVL